MAVEKMELVSIVGPIDDFDRVVLKYVYGKNIHLEDVINEIGHLPGLKSYKVTNPYDDLMTSLSETLQYTGISSPETENRQAGMKSDEIARYTTALNAMLSAMSAQRKELTAQIDENTGIINQLDAIKNVDIKLAELFDFKFIKIRFGKMPHDSYTIMDTYLKDYDTFFFKFGEDKDNIYGIYISPSPLHNKVDSIFSSLRFQRERISEKADGTPAEVIAELAADRKSVV